MISTTIILTTLFLLSHAAEEGDAPSGECFIKSKDDPKYFYDPTTGKGPMDWGSIEGFETCATGREQSPIDFATNVSYAPLEDGPKPSIMVADMDLASETFNWALKCPEGSDCGSTTFGGKTFNLINLHFHSPSENTLNGKQFPMEAHMVHSTEDGQLAVLATMFDFVDEESYQYIVYNKAKKDFGGSPLISAIVSNLKRNKVNFPVFLGSVIDANKGYCVYAGSLTTPPCTEGVTWLMSQNVKTVTERQVSDYLMSTGAGFVDGNNRPVQPTNGRNITCYIL